MAEDNTLNWEKNKSLFLAPLTKKNTQVPLSHIILHINEKINE